MPNKLIYLILPFLWFLTVLVQAGELSQTQEKFLTAEKAIKQGDLKTFSELKKQLQNYPLLPYLEYLELTQNLDQTSTQAIDNYLKKYHGDPSEIRLRWTILFHLAKAENWPEFLNYYEENSNRRLQCHRLTALIKTNKAKQAYKIAEPLWLTASSLPEACDDAFGLIHKAGQLKPEWVWKRMNLIRGKRSKKRAGLMRYMGKLLPAKHRSYHQLWMASLGSPEKVVQSQQLNQQHVSRGDLLVHSIARLGWRNRDLALRTWRKALKNNWLDSKQQRRVQSELGYPLYRRNHPRATAFFDQVKDCHKHYGLCNLRLRHALRQRNWPIIIKWYETLPKSKQDDERWGYWYARALQKTGKSAQAMEQFKKVAEDRSYYGFLAADKAGVKYRIDPNNLKFNQQQLKQITELAGIKRAKELYQLNRDYQARREWDWAIKEQNKEGLKMAAVVAKNWGWSNKAITTLLKTKYWDDLEIRFPLEHRKLVMAEAKRYGISPAWIFAVIRQESSFVTKARSPVGAMGLMQLMPATARSVARSLKIRRPGTAQILQPELNIRLGSRYLKTLYDKFSHRVILATPSYNAGPHRTLRWLPNKAVPADLWVEDIAFDETRLYVQRVMSYIRLYEHRLGMKPLKLKVRMPAISKRLISKRKRK